jgi:putative spermidine/putrescine transport system substrate-binding protein
MKSVRKPYFVATAMVGILALSSCSSAAPSDGASNDPGRLTFVTYGSAFQEAQEKAMVKPFMAETGIGVTVESPVDLAKLKVMVEAGKPTWDVYLADQQDTVGFCGELFEELDFSNINKEDFAPGTVDPCGVPVDTYSYVLAYNTEKYGNKPPTSIKDFFDTKNFPGIRSMSNYPQEGNFEMALLADGVKMKDMYPIDYDRAFKVLDRVKDGMVFWESGAEQVAAMETKRADMLLVWSGRGYEAVSNGAPYAPVWADNSYHWASLAIVKGSPNKKAAQKFIDYLVSPKPQKLFAESMAYGAANLKAAPALDPAKKDWDSSDSENLSKSWSIDNKWWAKNLDDAIQRWTDWTAG